MPTQNQDKDFARNVLESDSVLDKAIDWISSNLDPEEVFSDGDLATWANKNGFEKEN